MCVCVELRQARQRHRMRKDERDREWERERGREREGERESDSSARGGSSPRLPEMTSGSFVSRCLNLPSTAGTLSPRPLGQEGWVSVYGIGEMDLRIREWGRAVQALQPSKLNLGPSPSNLH